MAFKLHIGQSALSAVDQTAFRVFLFEGLFGHDGRVPFDIFSKVFSKNEGTTSPLYSAKATFSNRCVQACTAFASKRARFRNGDR
jgi:hypothetical protein